MCAGGWQEGGVVGIYLIEEVISAYQDHLNRIRRPGVVVTTEKNGKRLDRITSNELHQSYSTEFYFAEKAEHFYFTE